MSGMNSISTRGPSTTKAPLTFEFTKRKRWADLLITELVDVIIFIVSPSCQVLYCGTAITELLGWREDDVVDCDFKDLIVENDQSVFQSSFEESLRTNAEIMSYVLLKGNDTNGSMIQKHSLFEIKGYPHCLNDNDTSCKLFFLMAKPYPSRNTAMLNTFLELKMENERLQGRIKELKSIVPSTMNKGTSSQSSLPLQGNPIYANSSMSQPRILPATGAGHAPVNLESSNQFYSLSNGSNGIIDEGISRGLYDGVYSGTVHHPGVTDGHRDSENDVEDGSKKKKVKRSHGAEQYVCITCGRTDSPEWRKGPLGPKTLCNACGLRWAKQMRKIDDPGETGVSVENTVL